MHQLLILITPTEEIPMGGSMISAARLHEHIDPLVHNNFIVPGSNIRFSASCFPGADWSLGPLYEPEDAYVHRTLARKVGTALTGVGARQAFAPNPTGFNGKIALQSELSSILNLGEIYLHRNKKCLADGTFLSKKGDAFVVSAGGCGMAVVAYGNDLIAAHAGRECIIDRTRVEKEGKSQDRETDLVDEMLITIGAKDMQKVHAWPLYFIPPADFRHRFDDPNPKHAVYNRAAGRYLPLMYGPDAGYEQEGAFHINLAGIFKRQLMQRGVPEGNIHMDHADLHKELPTTRNGGGRYLATVVRHTEPR